MRRHTNFTDFPGGHVFALALQGLHGLNLPQQRTGMGDRGTKALNRAAEKTVIADNARAGAPLKRGERLQRDPRPNAQLDGLDNAQLRQRIVAIPGPMVDPRRLENPKFLVV